MGANIALVGNVPPFEYALPIRSAGAELEPIIQRLPRAPEIAMEMTRDASAGTDLPTLAKVDMHFTGPFAAQLSANVDQLTEERKRQLARNMDGGLSLLDVEIVLGEDDSEATLTFTGISTPMFTFDGSRGEFSHTGAVRDLAFSPDRSRRDWRDIPVSIGVANASRTSLRAILPGSLDGFELRGETSLDEEVAGRRFVREVSFEDGVLNLTELMTSRGGEIAPDKFAEERRKAAQFARNEMTVLAPEDAPRHWRFALGADREPLAGLEAAYAQLIANDPDEAGPYLERASFRYQTYDFAGSLADMDKVVEIEGTAEYYSNRANVYMQLLDFESARDDLEEAYILEPTPWRAMQYAGSLFTLDEVGEARAILEGEDGNEEVRRNLAVSLAHYDAYEGKGEAGLARLDEQLSEDPNNAYLLNQKCWFMGAWKVRLDEALDVCRRAVENGGDAAAIDSRAMVYLRRGEFDAALQDVEAALAIAPDQTATILLRGLIRLEQGDKGGQEDIDMALARYPMSAAEYRKFGFDL